MGILQWKQTINSYITILISIWLMSDCWRYILPTLPLSFSEKENLGKPKEEIGNLNGLEYM